MHMAYKVTKVSDLIALMRDLQGDQTSTTFASNIGISKQYLCDVYNRRREPNARVLSAIGVQAVITYPTTGDTEYLVQPTEENLRGKSKERQGIQGPQRKVKAKGRKARSG
jgi:hypothetical protein